MKKLFAVLVVLSVLMCANALAEEPVVEELEIELDETYVPVDLGEDYAYAYLPADWQRIEVEYGDENSELLGAFTDSEGTSMLMVVYAESETATSYEEIYNKSVEAGLNANLAIFNGFEFASIAAMTDDQLTMICTHFVDEEYKCAITFTFTFPAANAENAQTVISQALASLNFHEV